MRPGIPTFALLILTATALAARADVLVDFEDLSLPPGTFDNGDPGNLAPGEAVETTFVSQGAGFNNRFAVDAQTQFPFWTGWAISSVEDATTPGFGNQYASYAGGGSGGSGTYGVAFDTTAFINLPTLGFEPVAFSMEVTNTTYTALSMLNGDAFSQPFGGVAGGGGSVPDFLLLTITGYDDLNATGAAIDSVDFYLADYRFEDNSLDYIVQDWTAVDLAPLIGARSLGFSYALSPALIDPVFGPTVPLYFAMDNLRLVPIPEPSSLALLALGVGALGLALRRRGASR